MPSSKRTSGTYTIFTGSSEIYQSIVGNVRRGNANTEIYSTQVNFYGNTLTLGDSIIEGNLRVQGNISYINANTLVVEDPIIIAGTGPNGQPLTVDDGRDRGLYLEYYQTNRGNAFFGWDNSTGNLIIASNNTISNDIVSVVDYGNLWAGNIRVQNIVSNGSAGLAGNITVGGYANIGGDSNVAGQALFGSNVDITGRLNVSANIWSISSGSNGGYFFGNIRTANGGYDNTNVKTYLESNTTINLSIGLGNITTQANISAGNVIGNLYGNILGNVIGNLIVPGPNSGVIFNNDGNADSDSQFTFDVATAAVTLLGNITANYFVGDGSQLSNLNYSNANVANYLPTYTGNFNPNAITVASLANLGDAGNVMIYGGDAGQALLTSGNGALLFGNITATPAGNVGAFQYNGGNATEGLNEFNYIVDLANNTSNIQCGVPLIINTGVGNAYEEYQLEVNGNINLTGDIGANAGILAIGSIDKVVPEDANTYNGNLVVVNGNTLDYASITINGAANAAPANVKTVTITIGGVSYNLLAWPT